ncbi:MAG: hypothetical protein ACREUZ_09650, partial [Burkholderiales bacterium]
MVRAALTLSLTFATYLFAVAPPQGATTSQAAQPAGARQQPPSGRAAVPVDEERARQLYVSNRPEDHAGNYDFDRDVKARIETETRYAEASRGVMDFRKVSYRSGVGDMDVPAYLFQPLKTRGPG